MLSHWELEKRKHERYDLGTSITVTTGSAYASGNVMGGLITLDGSASAVGPVAEPPLSSILQSMALLDPDSENSAIDLFFFGSLPATTFTDKTAFAPSLADLQNCIGVVSVNSSDYIYGGANGTVAGGKNLSNIGRVLKPLTAKSTKVYCVPVCRGTPTYTAGNLYFRFQFSHGL